MGDREAYVREKRLEYEAVMRGEIEPPPCYRCYAPSTHVTTTIMPAGYHAYKCDKHVPETPAPLWGSDPGWQVVYESIEEARARVRQRTESYGIDEAQMATRLEKTATALALDWPVDARHGRVVVADPLGVRADGNLEYRITFASGVCIVSVIKPTVTPTIVDAKWRDEDR